MVKRPKWLSLRRDMTRARGTPGMHFPALFTPKMRKVAPEIFLSPHPQGGIFLDKSMDATATCHVLDMPSPKSTIGWVLSRVPVPNSAVIQRAASSPKPMLPAWASSWRVFPCDFRPASAPWQLRSGRPWNCSPYVSVLCVYDYYLGPFNGWRVSPRK